MVPMNIVNLYENYNNYFNDDLKAILARCSKIASKHNFKLYLIGGIVRDMLLNQFIIANEVKQSKKIEHKFLDIDITVEGDAIEFCNIMEKEGFAKILSLHPDFGTAKVLLGVGTERKKLDFASTRCEIYPKKGHLPVVSEIGCSLECDVKRRDFTINSLALSLNDYNLGYLIDYVGGFEDLKSKKLRILHDNSFIDDPTRIIRGLKFAARLGFEVEEYTLQLQKEYLNNINYDMGYSRVKSELKQTFSLNSQSVFEKFINEGIYKLLAPNKIKLPKENIENLIKHYKPKHPWLVYFGLLAADGDFYEKLELTNAEKDVVVGAKSLLSSKIPDDDFGIYKLFGAFQDESLLIFAVLGNEKEKVFKYFDSLKKIKLAIGGNDLLDMGVEPSKVYGEIFDYVLKKKIENPKLTLDDERKIVTEYIANSAL